MKTLTLTQAVETEGGVVEEEADVAGPRRHAAEGVSAAGRQRINAAGEQEDHQRPDEGVLPRCLHQHHRHRLPEEVPAGSKSTSFDYDIRRLSPTWIVWPSQKK